MLFRDKGRQENITGYDKPASFMKVFCTIILLFGIPGCVGVTPPKNPIISHYNKSKLGSPIKNPQNNTGKSICNEKPFTLADANTWITNWAKTWKGEAGSGLRKKFLVKKWVRSFRDHEDKTNQSLTTLHYMFPANYFRYEEKEGKAGLPFSFVLHFLKGKLVGYNILKYPSDKDPFVKWDDFESDLNSYKIEKNTRDTVIKKIKGKEFPPLDGEYCHRALDNRGNVAVIYNYYSSEEKQLKSLKIFFEKKKDGAEIISEWEFESRPFAIERILPAESLF